MRRGVLLVAGLVAVCVVLVWRPRKVQGLFINVHDDITLLERLRMGFMRVGSKRRKGKPDVSLLAEDGVHRDAGDRPTWREKVEDRENDRYREKVKYIDTGRVIVDKDERLSDHRGHGSAKGQGNAGGPQPGQS
jgi:hypothetical protein